MGFALGLLAGRLLISQVLVHIAAITVLSWASAVMAATPSHFAHAQCRHHRGTRGFVWRDHGFGIAITFDWIGLAVSSTIIDAMAGRAGVMRGICAKHCS